MSGQVIGIGDQFCVCPYSISLCLLNAKNLRALSVRKFWPFGIIIFQVRSQKSCLNFVVIGTSPDPLRTTFNC